MITKWNATTKKVLKARETIDVCLPYPSRARSMKIWIEPDTPAMKKDMGTDSATGPQVSRWICANLPNIC